MDGLQKFILLLVTIFVVASLFSSSVINEQDNKKFDTCVNAANEAGLDPNYEDRVNFIKSCFQD